MLTVDYNLLEVKPGQRVLDAGCGAGRHSFEFFRHGAELFALDYSPEEVKKVMYSLVGASAEDKAAGGSWQTVCGDVHNLPFESGFFDRIICSEVCEHVHEDTRVLKEFARIMKPRGRIAITVPTYLTEWAYGKLSPLYFTNPGGHVRKFIPRELASKLEYAGFKVYAIRFAHGYHSAWWLLRCIFGLEDAKHPISAAYQWVLVKAIYSQTMSRLEGFFNYLTPKSIIFYAWKP